MIGMTRSATWKRMRVTIATSTTLSESFASGPGAIFGLEVPSTFDGTSIGFQTSHDDVTYQDLYDNTGLIVALTVGASKSYDLPTALAAWPYFKIKCATAQTTTDTDFYVVAKG